MARWRTPALVVLLALAANAPVNAVPGAPVPHPVTPRDHRRDISVEIVGLEADILPSITPTIRVRAVVTELTPPPVTLGIELSTSPTFASNILVDTFAIAPDSVDFVLREPLPSDATLFLRANARTDLGEVIFSAVSGAKRVPEWLSLVSPNSPNGSVLDENAPTFTWSSARVADPPGPWQYDFRITTSTGGNQVYEATTSDTSLTLPVSLEFNTSYRWSVTARLSDGASVRVGSRSSFVIVDETVPKATILYQTFPNPFPSAFAEQACIWFDIDAYATVTVDILDLRFNMVRRIFPRGSDPRPLLPPGRYGRAPNGDGGCDAEMSWDGRDETGRSVLPGVYHVRLRAGARTFVKSLIFRGG